MEPDRPLTAKEAVLRDIQADKLPVNREAERQLHDRFDDSQDQPIYRTE